MGSGRLESCEDCVTIAAMDSLNSAFTRLSMRRRYESWFHRFELSDKSGAWWLRYLLQNPGREGCSERGVAPVQVWATWFPRGGTPETVIGGFSAQELGISGRVSPFRLRAGPNEMQEGSCRGELTHPGGSVSWDLRYCSNFAFTMSNKGWIGFSRTPHSDASFSGEIRWNERVFRGDPLGIGVQGHNCGFRHRNFWTWAHACFRQADGSCTTFEALVYEMPFSLVFRRAVLWHAGKSYVFRNLRESARDPQTMSWVFRATSTLGSAEFEIDGSGALLHRVPYAKTDCSGTFEVANNSLAGARLKLRWNEASKIEEFSTDAGSVLEMAGKY